MAVCNAPSTCGTITASVACLPSMTQGENYNFEVQLNDAAGNPLDLCQYDAIVMKLYGEAVDMEYENIYYGYWGYPSGLSSEINETLNVLQEGCPPDSVTDQGLVGFDISYDISRYFNTGALYAEFKFKEDIPGAEPVYTIITCLKIGNVKKSTTRDLFF